ncbi:MAG TPA: hypothetical protein DDZ91_11775 [Firmicutes bacterium]|nr:hypothetical protein [Bacillota bacterium]
MKYICIFLMLFVLLVPINIASADQGEVVDIGSIPGSGDTLIVKVNQMASDLYHAASRVIIPITIIAVIIGALAGIFFPLCRSIALFAILGLVLVLWAPLLVNGVANWAR